MRPDENCRDLGLLGRKLSGSQRGALRFAIEAVALLEMDIRTAPRHRAAAGSVLPAGSIVGLDAMDVAC